MLKNRTFIGIICIAAAIAIVFAVSPIMNKVFEGKQMVVVLKTDIFQGQQITGQNISLVEMASFNLPADVVTDPKLLLGKYAKSNLYSGSFLFSNMLTEAVDTSDSLLRNLQENEFAMSISIRNFANGFSGNLRTGDIIMITSVDNDKNAVVYDELRYLEVLTTTTDSGIDNLYSIPGIDAEVDLPTTITVILQDMAQAVKLSECENSNLHAVFISRDEKKKADYIKAQAEILEKIKESEEEERSDENV